MDSVNAMQTTILTCRKSCTVFQTIFSVKDKEVFVTMLLFLPESRVKIAPHGGNS